MSNIRVEILSDWHECETCGASSAEGLRIYVDDKLVIDRPPLAHCFDVRNCDLADGLILLLG
jgi:hypothetical protein